MRVENGAFDMVTTVPSVRPEERPSTAARKEWLRLSTFKVMTEVSGTTIGRTLRLWGATAVRHSVPVEGAIIGPPLDRLYAVEPVGVVTISPSA